MSMKQPDFEPVLQAFYQLFFSCGQGESGEGSGNSGRPMGARVSIDDDANGKVAEKRLIGMPSPLDGAFVSQNKFGSQDSIASSWTSTDSKEEMFFDAQAWQESSSEDDFYSVNGDFIPSGASSPIHRRSFTGFPPVTRSRSSFFKHESPSFTEKKEPLDHGNALPNPKYKKEIELAQFFQDRYLDQSGGTARS